MALKSTTLRSMTLKSTLADPRRCDQTHSNRKLTRTIQICALALASAISLAMVQPALAQTFSVLYTFTGGPDGGAPFANVSLDSAGNIYGTTQRGGDAICSCGVVFKVDPTGAETALHTFVQTDGSTPTSALVFDAQGNIYGTTIQGGPGGSGVAFKLTPSGTYKILHAFTDTRDGGNPQGVTLDGAGNLYGVSRTGGPNNSNNCNFGCGTLWKLSPPGKLTVLHNFAGGTDGNAPVGIVVLDPAGDVYGTTRSGGNINSDGTVFKYTKNGLYSVRPLTASFGINPTGGLVLDGQGNFYGPTNGGTVGDGSIFRMDATLTFTGAFSFTGADGQNPNGGLTLDADGNIYGTTYDGGTSGSGTAFEITSTGETVLHSFDAPTGGQNPAAGVAIDAAGNIYGTTFHGGGTSNYGVVFKITP